MPQLRNLARGLELIARGSGSLIEQQRRLGVPIGADDSRLRVGKVVVVSSFWFMTSPLGTVSIDLCPTCCRHQILLIPLLPSVRLTRKRENEGEGKPAGSRSA